jgi:hypothetical protein
MLGARPAPDQPLTAVSACARLRPKRPSRASGFVHGREPAEGECQFGADGRQSAFGRATRLSGRWAAVVDRFGRRANFAQQALLQSTAWRAVSAERHRNTRWNRLSHRQKPVCKDVRTLLGPPEGALLRIAVKPDHRHRNRWVKDIDH